MFQRWFEKVASAFGLKVTKLQVKQALHATVIRACKECGAPGVDSYGQDVGQFCPECMAVRPKPEDLGRIWAKLG